MSKVPLTEPAAWEDTSEALSSAPGLAAPAAHQRVCQARMHFCLIPRVNSIPLELEQVGWATGQLACKEAFSGMSCMRSVMPIVAQLSSKSGSMPKLISTAGNLPWG